MQATLVAEAAVAEEKRRREEVVSLCAARRELRTQQKFFRAWRKFVRKQVGLDLRILKCFWPEIEPTLQIPSECQGEDPERLYAGPSAA